MTEVEGSIERKNIVVTAEKSFRYQLKDGSWFIIERAVLRRPDVIFSGAQRHEFVVKYCIPYDNSKRPKEDENYGLLVMFPKFIGGTEIYHHSIVNTPDSITNGNIVLQRGRPNLKSLESEPNWLHTDYHSDPELETDVFKFAADFLEEIIEKYND